MTNFDPHLNEGVLFRNDKKQTEKHPDYTGSWTDANGVEYWLNAWINESKAGKKYMKVKLGNPKGEVAQVGQPAQPAPVTESEDIPF
jgi:uncharacterized protein (DUF736 family)